MANVFIIWDNQELAQEVRKRVSEYYPDDNFIIGGESNNELAITSDILAEMASSDFAICLISKAILSGNLLYELGYLTAQLQDSYRLLVFLVNQSRASLPFDISVNRSFTVMTHLDAQPLYDLVRKEYGSSKERDRKVCGQKYISIFNNWPSIKRQLSDLRNGVFNPERTIDCVVHSIISTYYYGQNEQQDLLSICKELPNPNGALTALKGVITLVAEHYKIGTTTTMVSRFPIELSKEENIWLQFYAALYNGLQAVTLVNRELIEKERYRPMLELSLQFTKQAEMKLDEIEGVYFSEWKAPNFYISMLRGFLWNNSAAVYWAQERLYQDNNDAHFCLQQSIKFREMALRSYDALARADKSDVILDALEKECCWGSRKEIQYLEEMKGMSCQSKRTKLKERIEQINHKKLIHYFLDELEK